MKKLTIVLALALVFPAAAMAADASGSCGVGSKVFTGQRGVAPQVLAMITNGTFFQTFAVSSGTSGCQQDGVVASNWKMSMFIDNNKDQLARDMSVGSGETLASLSQLIGVKDADKAAFYRATKENFAQIFTSDKVSAEEVAAGLKQVMAADSTLAQYSVAI